METITNISLWCREGSSDKVYHVAIEKDSNDGYFVNFSYGRRGRPLLYGTKTSTPVTRWTAERLYNNLVESKMAKGYKETTKRDIVSESVANKKVVNRAEVVENTPIISQVTNKRKFNFEG